MNLLVTMEDHVVSGGFGSAVLEVLQDGGVHVPVERIGWPDEFVDHGNGVEVLRASYGISFEDNCRRVIERFRSQGEKSVEAVL